MSRFANEYRAAQYARKEADKQARIAAFGAIRRAAEIARQQDREAERDRYEHGGEAHRYEDAAALVRDAIRAAIESPKA